VSSNKEVMPNRHRFSDFHYLSVAYLKRLGGIDATRCHIGRKNAVFE